MNSNRLVLALEVLVGALPITIIGGGYTLLGVLFGSVSVFLGIREHAFNVVALWLGILGLAAGGLFGIVGLWVLIALSAGLRPRSSMTRVALTGSTAGVMASVVTLLLMLGGSFERRPPVIYLLVAPILVVLHRRPAVKRLVQQLAETNRRLSSMDAHSASSSRGTHASSRLWSAIILLG
jgi:hypothetical protein